MTAPDLQTRLRTWAREGVDDTVMAAFAMDEAADRLDAAGVLIANTVLEANALRGHLKLAEAVVSGAKDWLSTVKDQDLRKLGHETNLGVLTLALAAYDKAREAPVV